MIQATDEIYSAGNVRPPGCVQPTRPFDPVGKAVHKYKTSKSEIIIKKESLDISYFFSVIKEWKKIVD